jgi:N-acetylneuraminic acid mutarotase
MTASGRAPQPRQGHSAVMLGSSMLVFGGSRRRAWFNDVHVLDTDALRWTSLDALAGRAPEPRAYHSATALSASSMLLFGGNGPDRAFNDVHVLSLTAGGWSQPVVCGVPPSPRCGAAFAGGAGQGALLFGGWDVVGVKEVQVFNDGAWGAVGGKWGLMWAVHRLVSDAKGQWTWLSERADMDHLTGAACWSVGNEVFVFGGQGAPPDSRRSSRVLCLGGAAQQEAVVPSEDPQLLLSMMANVRSQALVKCAELGIDAKVSDKLLDSFFKLSKSGQSSSSTLEQALAHVLDQCDGPAFGRRAR